MPDDLAGMYDEFLEELLGCEGAEEQRFQDHLTYETTRERARRTLRCVLRGCSVMTACRWWPRCDRCNGRCRRCGRPMLPVAEIRRDDA